MSNLNKASRLAREKAERARQQRRAAARLDPKFPFRVVSFDAKLFGVAPK